jgi:hypothetical protein
LTDDFQAALRGPADTPEPFASRQFTPLSSTTLLVTVLRTIASCVPSGYHSKSTMSPRAYSASTRGWPPSIGWTQMLRPDG